MTFSSIFAFLSRPVAQYFSGGILWKFLIPQPHLADVLRGRKRIVEAGDLCVEVSLIAHMRFIREYLGDDGVALLVHQHLPDALDQPKARFQHLRRHIFPVAEYDQVLLPPGQIDKSIGIQMAEISRVVSAAWHRRRLWVLSSPCEDWGCGRLRKTAEKPTGLDLYGKCQLELTGILP